MAEGEKDAPGGSCCNGDVTPIRSAAPVDGLVTLALSCMSYVGSHPQDRRPRSSGRNRGVSRVTLVRPPADYPANISPGDHSLRSGSSNFFAGSACRFLNLPDKTAHAAITSSLRHCGSRLRTPLLDASLPFSLRFQRFYLGMPGANTPSTQTGSSGLRIQSLN